MKEWLSPNFSSRNGRKIGLLVLHYTGMLTARAALERLCEKEAQVSAHYVVDEDGSLHKLVAEAHCAWHAGVSYWRGHKNVNAISIGIEIVNPGHAFGYRPFPEAQMQAVSALCQDITARYALKSYNIVAHSDVAPLRKSDPGELFDWNRISPSLPYTPPAFNQILPIPIEKLHHYGYEMPTDPQDYPRIATAFQRHFRQNAISGQWDNECEGILTMLLKMQ